jgi:hypothetical protein
MSTLFASRTPRLVERPLASTTARDERSRAPARIAPADKQPIAKDRFLMVLLRSLSALSV